MALCISHKDFQIVIGEDGALPAITVTDQREGIDDAQRLEFEKAAEALFADVFDIIAANGHPRLEALAAALPDGVVISSFGEV